MIKIKKEKKSLESEIKERENKGNNVISNQKIIIREYAIPPTLFSFHVLASLIQFQHY
jgi:hypothetical protein